MMFKNLSIKYKLFLTYTAVSLMVFALSFSLLFFQIRETLEDRIREELSKSNQTITDMVETAATVSIKNHLRGIAEKNLEIIRHIHKNFLENRLTESEARQRAVRTLLSQTVGNTGYIYCVDSLGIAVVHPREKVQGKSFASRPFVQTQIREKEGYLEYNWQNPGETNKRSKALYMCYFEPWDWIISVASYKSEFSKLVTIDDFKDRILGLTFGKTGYSFIFDTRGNVVIHPQLSGNFFQVQDVNGVQIIQQMIEQKKGYQTYYWKNPSEPAAREKFVAFSHIPVFDWIIASSSYTDEIFSPLTDIRTRFLFMLVLAVLLTGLVSMVISTSITRPLTKLINRFEKGVQGNLISKIDSTRLDETRQDEIGQLSAGFNRFMDRLATYQKNIKFEINNRKKTDQELQTLRNHLVNIIDSMPSMLIGLDKNLIVTLWNEKAAQETGISMDKAHGTSVQEVLPRIRDHIPRIMESLKTRGIRQIFKNPCISPTGEPRYETITIFPLSDATGESAVIRIDDVTETLRLEETLIQNEKMLSVGGLAAGMAHEINNPLAAVIQNAGLLSNRLTDMDMPANIRAADAMGTNMETIRNFMTTREIPNIIDAIIDSGARMAEIVGNMLSFARKSDSSFSTHDPTALMDKTLNIAATDYDLKKHYDFKSITIEKEYGADLPFILCEGGKIQQVLLNILNNGAQAMADNPDHRPSRFIIRMVEERKTGMIRMEIEDNGPGMEPAVKKRIFEPFFTTKPVGIGTGLGLSVSYFIITENHKGTLHVLSTPGKGSRFIIRLPLSAR